MTPGFAWKFGAGLAVGAVLFLLVLAVIRLDSKLTTRTAERDRALTQVAKLERDAALKEQAALERAADDRAIDSMKEDLTDAINGFSPAQPGAARVALGCARLRAAGADIRRLPACSGPAR